jgi:twinkle protein
MSFSRSGRSPWTSDGLGPTWELTPGLQEGLVGASNGHETEATFLFHTSCGECGSSDANAAYDDGHLYCFSCQQYTKPSEEMGTIPKPRNNPEIQLGDTIEGLYNRNITETTCRFFNYSFGEYGGKRAYFAPYYDANNKLVAVKIRLPKKQFLVAGSLKEALPFGAQKFQRTGKHIVVTEGEIDAMAMSQVQGNKWPVVSVANGAAGAKRFMAKHSQYFAGFDRVVLMFDSDEPGRQAAESCAKMLGSRAAIAVLPEKDAAEMVRQGRNEELLDAMWRAKKYAPQGLVDLQSDEVMERALAEVKEGEPWYWPQITALTHGWRYGELYALGAATAAGKTDFMLQQVLFNLERNIDCGVFFLEQTPDETGIRLCGKLVKTPLHADPSEDGKAAISAAWKLFNKLPGRVSAYDSFGQTDWSDIAERMRYLTHNEGVRFFVLDHITALASGLEDERKELDRLMREMGSLVKELSCAILFVSHLASPDGTPHEEGGRVHLKQFRGSRAISFWCHYAFGLERNQQAEDVDERRTTRMRVLKDRFLGTAVGHIVTLQYDFTTGMLEETVSAEVFEDESEEGSSEASDF